MGALQTGCKSPDRRTARENVKELLLEANVVRITERREES
jgi:hypothetical protein